MLRVRNLGRLPSVTDGHHLVHVEQPARRGGEGDVAVVVREDAEDGGVGHVGLEVEGDEGWMDGWIDRWAGWEERWCELVGVGLVAGRVVF